MAPNEAVLTTGQVAHICQVAPRTVSKWFDSGQLRGYRVPGSRDRRVPRKELIRFMRAHRLPLNGLDTGATRILVVDPSGPSSTSLLTALNRLERYEAQSAASAFAAGVAAAQFEPHVILVNPSTSEVRLANFRVTDGTSHEMQGFKLLAIASEQAGAQELQRQGYDRCLVRPFGIDDVLKTIDAVVLSD